MDTQPIKQKKRRENKVIKYFTIEVMDASSDPELFANPSNPYTLLSDEEREREFFEMFALLLAETCRDAVKDNYVNKKGDLQKVPEFIAEFI